MPTNSGSLPICRIILRFRPVLGYDADSRRIVTLGSKLTVTV